MFSCHSNDCDISMLCIQLINNASCFLFLGYLSHGWDQKVQAHYSRKLLCRRPEAVGLGLECRRLSLTWRLFSDAVGLGAVGVIGRRVRAKYGRVRLCRRLRLTRRPRNAVGSGQFQFFLKNSKFWKKIKKFIFLLLFLFF
jgi:hypothetical protein